MFHNFVLRIFEPNMKHFAPCILYPKFYWGIINKNEFTCDLKNVQYVIYVHLFVYWYWICSMHKILQQICQIKPLLVVLNQKKISETSVIQLFSYPTFVRLFNYRHSVHFRNLYTLMHYVSSEQQGAEGMLDGWISFGFTKLISFK